MVWEFAIGKQGIQMQQLRHGMKCGADPYWLPESCPRSSPEWKPVMPGWKIWEMPLVPLPVIKMP